MPADEGERWRVFLAIEVPHIVRKELTAPLSALEPLGEIVRISAVDRIHLTLHFLDHLPRSDVERLPPALGPVVARHQHFRLAAEGVGAFPNIRRPRVVWAGIAGADLSQLMALHAELGDALRKGGVTVDDRFDPHLTLARVPRPLKAAERKALLDWSARWGPTWFGEIPVDQVRLMRSQLGSGPPRYTTVATFALQ
ncbi:MAG: RNA 2',3'-cyclic phosphodiesterase [Candidatus Dormibacteraeota bacterium]|nr:RNA 2',3'-cyclic phosphodiesterase [Candidatus Dormibacteraeota bacterium]